MGGSFFASGPDPLYTPRMPPEVYQLVKEACHRALRELYVCVASPIDGPAKKDFGDVDLLTTWSRQEILGLPPPESLSASVASREKGKVPDELDYIGAALGAERMVRESGRVGAHYAIPWPSSLSTPKVDDNEDMAGQAEEGGEDPRSRYIQVDVRVLPSLQSFQWILFRHAHGDLWNILGSTIRPLGLTADEDALWIRIPEIESANRNRAKVKITEDPAQVMRILGLEAERYGEGPFATLDELYEYAATSPMFWVRELPEESLVASVDTGGGDTTGKSPADGGVAEDKRRLRSNDRQRMKTRHCYRLWIEEFLPKCRAQGRFLKPSCTRESVAASIFAQFPVQGEYDRRLAEYRVERQWMDIWRDEIKGFLAGLDLAGRHPAYKGCLAKALKRIILEDDESYGVGPTKRLKGEHGEFVMGDVREFIRGSYEAVGEAALRAHHGKKP